MPAIDNVPFLEAIHGVLKTGDDLINMLNEANQASGQTPEGSMVFDLVKTVVETQATIIRKLTEHQMELTDTLEDIMTRYNVQ